MKTQKILVLGGTGKTGRRVAERLIQLGENVRIGSRRAEPPFDWHKPEGWEAVLDKVDSVYITFQPDLAVPGTRQIMEKFISTAVKVKVQKMVLLSGKGEKEAELCEQILMETGVDWTIVRASWFNQNFNESFFLDPILAGHLALPKADVPVPYVDADDIADVVVETLLNNKHTGQIYELTGPRQLTFEQVADEISAATGRTVHFHSITAEEYTKVLREAHVPEDYIWLIDYLFTEVLNEENSGVSGDIEKVLGRKAKDFTEYARETAATGIWHPKSEVGVIN